jgi:hypothetical protein
MENQRPIKRHSLAAAALVLLSACAGAPVASTPSPPLAPIRLAVTQTGAGPAARYVYCEESACPPPSRKTPVAQIAPASLAIKDDHPAAERAAPATGPYGVDVAFPFNSPRIGEADKKLLFEAAATHPGARVEITARSDFAGPRRGRRELAKARARAMRRVVAQQSPAPKSASASSSPDTPVWLRRNKPGNGGERFFSPLPSMFI